MRFLIRFFWWLFDLLRRGTIVLIEPHGDLCMEVMRSDQYKWSGRHDLLYFDPAIQKTMNSYFGKTVIDHDLSFVRNPFELKDQSEEAIYYVGEQLAYALYQIIGESWGTTQQMWLLASVTDTGLRIPWFTLFDLMNFMDDRVNEKYYELWLKNPNPVHRNFFKNSFYSKESNFWATKRSLYLKLHKILSKRYNARTLVGKSTIDLGEILNSWKTVIFNLAQGRMSPEGAAAFWRLLVAHSLGIALKRQDIKKSKRQDLLMYIDEWGKFATPTFSDILTGARKYKYFLVLASQYGWQDINSDMEKEVYSNTSVLIGGRTDKATQEKLAYYMEMRDSEEYMRLPNHTFWLYNRKKKRRRRKNHKLKAHHFKIPRWFAKDEGMFYMNDEELEELVTRMAYESWIYKDVGTFGEQYELGHEIIEQQPLTSLSSERIEYDEDDDDMIFIDPHKH